MAQHYCHLGIVIYKLFHPDVGLFYWRLSLDPMSCARAHLETDQKGSNRTPGQFCRSFETSFLQSWVLVFSRHNYENHALLFYSLKKSQYKYALGRLWETDLHGSFLRSLCFSTQLIFSIGHEMSFIFCENLFHSWFLYTPPTPSEISEKNVST